VRPNTQLSELASSTKDMANKNHKKFLKAAQNKAFDKQHRKTIAFNIGRYDKAVADGKQQYTHLEKARKHAKNIKWAAIEKLDMYLLEFEHNFTARGGKVVWASTAEDALKAIEQITKKHETKMVIKSKSMVTEEIRLNEHLEELGITVNETDLGEYIVQLAGEKPYHIITPAMHKSKEDVADLFHKKLDTQPNSSPKQLAQAARNQLREKYTTADLGITGANFMVADIGAIAITENEGNAWLTMAYPKTHVAIVGIEKMLSSIDELTHLWPLLATFGTGQHITVYNSLLFGPRQATEKGGPENMYVILLDNGRSKLLANVKQRESLYCIRCGACLNACPIYQNIGGHSYDTAYPGPIGSVIMPQMSSLKANKHLSEASSLCGNCTEVCPVNINLHNLLLNNRKESIDKNLAKTSEYLGWKLWQKTMLNRNWLNNTGPFIKTNLLRFLFKKSWGKNRTLPQIPKKSFNEQWADKQLLTNKKT